MKLNNGRSIDKANLVLDTVFPVAKITPHTGQRNRTTLAAESNIIIPLRTRGFSQRRAGCHNAAVQSHSNRSGIDPPRYIYI